MYSYEVRLPRRFDSYLGEHTKTTVRAQRRIGCLAPGV